MLGKARRGPLILSGEKAWSYGEGDPRQYLKGSVWVLETRGDISNFCVGVRDPGRYPEFLCRCKRPGEISRIYMWV